MIKPTILVTGADLAPEALALLTDYHIVFAGVKPTESDLVHLCQQHNPIAILVRYGKITKRVMDAASNLQVISKHGSGIDTIDKKSAEERNIKVVAAAGVNATAVAEHAIALLLACAKSIPLLDKRMHQALWDKATHKSIELSGKTVGIIGFGAIGRHFAHIANSFGMKIIAYDAYVNTYPDYVTPTSLNDIWKYADIISLHCPLTEDNRKMINANVLSQCKQGLILINTARGGLIDEQALLDAVNSGKIFAAGLDCFDQEPIATEHIFQQNPKFILSPHIGGVTREAYVNMGITAANNILKHIT